MAKQTLEHAGSIIINPTTENVFQNIYSSQLYGTFFPFSENLK